MRDNRDFRVGRLRPSAVGQCLSIIYITIVFASFCVAQESYRMSGTVVDLSGAVVANAHVKLIAGGKTVGEATTSSNGTFAISTDLQADTIEVTAPGFTTLQLPFTNRGSNALTLQPAGVAEQVNVVANRSAVPTAETAESVAILSQNEIRTSAASAIDEVLRQVPGFTLFRRSSSIYLNPTAQGVSLRGTNASGSSRALVLVDGIPLNDPFGGWIFWDRVPIANVNRIEVLKGGSSELYGSDALAGTVALFTQPLDLSRVTLETSYGTENTPLASLSGTLRRGPWAGNLSAETYSTGGYNQVEQSQRGRIDHNINSEHDSGSLTLQYGDPRGSRGFVRGATLLESRHNGTPFQINNNRLYELDLGADIPTTGFGTFITRAYGLNEDYNQTFSSVANDRNSETPASTQHVPSHAFGISEQWSAALGKRNVMVAGVEGSLVSGATHDTALTNRVPSSLTRAGGEERDFSVYLQDMIQLTARDTLTVGGRLDEWWNLDGSSLAVSLPKLVTTASNVFPRKSEAAFSPRLAFNHRFTDNVSASASAYRSFRQPTLNELYRAFRLGNILTLANAGLQSERLSGAEAGLSVSGLNRRLYLHGGFFWNHISEPVANITLSTTPKLITRQRTNLGSIGATGVELQNQIQLTSRLTIDSGYQFANSKVLSFPANRLLEGLDVPQYAHHQATTDIRYAFARGWMASVQARASSRQFEDDQNLLPLGGYFTFDSYASAPLTHGLQMFLAVENVLNRQYLIGRTPTPLVAAPITGRIGLRLTWPKL
ncbi:MAG TPA: TonB-dependent receptor [Terriglobales bacterium]|nr:TonB-dependent receptor [Terriglobales bacterium]